jgi:hypothetical protein
MAFPGTFNISYYRGDTLEFKVYPKNSSGENFSLSTFNPLARMTIAPRRGELLAGEQRIQAYAEIIDGDYILCVIRPEDGQKMIAANSPYYYDLEIEDFATAEYLKLYTILTGEIAVTEQVTPGVESPYPVQNLRVTGTTANSISIAWDEPVAGEYAAFIVGVNNQPTLVGATTQNLPGTARTFTFTVPMPGIPYYFGIVTLNASAMQSPANLYPSGVIPVDEES